MLETDEFSDLFIQMFVESNGTINVAYFNTFHKTSFSFKEIITAVKTITGSKLVPFREPDATDRSFIFSMFTKSYQFGKYPNARDYLYEVWEQTDTVLPRSMVLTWISQQRPEKSLTSFAPANDRNHYHDSKESKPVRKPTEDS
ncbi:hypothetical protein My1_028 [Pectobacterium phage My1]|uniref:Uncharacterized protein n=1 Tax=Pectobacterium phage My1 TaxID=1204539 RepID=J9QP94_9CAUD|nr:hypothetical protein My1_028 [Pectobacterium phage My1]AFQ22187.1 hypothetical protein My1_028 [Pectobacterium phage My1]